MNKISDRLKVLIDNEGISIRQFEKKINASNGVISRFLKHGTDINTGWVSKIIDAYPQYNLNWLFTGNGKMTKEKEYSLENSLTIIEDPELRQNYGLIPLYGVNSLKNLTNLLYNNQKMIPVSTIKVPDGHLCDGAVYVTGDNMYPLLKNNDIVVYKAVPDFHENIIWGNIYLVSTEHNGEEHISVNYVKKGSKEGYVELQNFNLRYDNREIPLSKIPAMAWIKFMLCAPNG